MLGILIIVFIALVILLEEYLKRRPKAHGISGALNWNIKNGTLYITGKGPMENFSNKNRSPWHTGITSVSIGNEVTAIGDNAFSFCTRLTDIVIPQNIKSVGQYAFSYCVGLKTVTIRNSPDNIKLYSGVFPSGVIVKFEKNGQVIHQYTVPDYEDDYEPDEESPVPATAASLDTISEIFDSVQTEAPDTVSWKVEKGVLTISGEGMMQNYSAQNPAPWGKNITAAVIESGITSVGSHSFYNCNKLKSIVIPDTVTSIGDSAFAWCTALEAVDLPKGLAVIEKAAFSCCSRLASIEIPDGVEAIPEDAFAYCDKLRKKLRSRT